MYDNPSGVADYGLAVSFAKILDPGSVAREGEVRAVQNAGAGFISRLRNAENFFKGNGTLPKKVRKQIMQAARSTYVDQLEIAKQAVAEAHRMAEAVGIPRDMVYKVVMPDPGTVISFLPTDDLDENEIENEEPIIQEAPSDLPPIPGPLEKKFKQKKGIGDNDVLSEADQQELTQTWIKMWNSWTQDKKDTYLLSD